MAVEKPTTLPECLEHDWLMCLMTHGSVWEERQYGMKREKIRIEMVHARMLLPGMEKEWRKT